MPQFNPLVQAKLAVAFIFSFVGDLRSRGDLLSDTEVGDPLGDRPARGDLLKAWGSPEGRRNRGSWEGAWGSCGGILPYQCGGRARVSELGEGLIRLNGRYK